jgi:hypothetical protein
MTTWQSLPVGVVGGLWVDGVSSSYSPNPEKNQFAIKKEEEVKCENVNRYNKKF